MKCENSHTTAKLASASSDFIGADTTLAVLAIPSSCMRRSGSRVKVLDPSQVTKTPCECASNESIHQENLNTIA